MPPEYIPLPFVRRGYEQNDTLGRLLQLRGNQQADAELRRGDASARMWSTLGQTIGDTVQGVVQAQERGKVAKAEQAEKAELSKRDTAYMKYISENPDPDPRVVVGIYGPRLGMTMVQGYKAFQELETGKVTNARDTAGRLAVGLKAASPALQATLWPRVREAAIKGGLGTAQDIPEQSSPEYLDAIIGWSTGREPAAPAKVPNRQITTRNPDGSESIQIVPDTAGQTFTSAAAPEKVTPPAVGSFGDYLVQAFGPRPTAAQIQTARRNYEAAGRAPAGPSNGDPGPLETIIGPDGKAIRVARRDAVGQPPAAGTEKASSGVQKRVLNFFNRAEQADRDLEALEPEIEQLNLGEQTWQAWAPNFAQTQLGQSYTAAQRAFTEARLRKDSGAAIPPHEFKSDQETYFAQPGDSKKTIQDKNRARAAMLASLAFESGQALGEFVGDADEARSIVERYKTRAARPGAQTPLVNGTTVEIPSRAAKVGERRTINGQLGEWDGKGWKLVQ